MNKLFSDVRGQKNAIRILSSQLETNSLSHAYLLLGEEGTGKEFLAREFSKYILCEDIKKEGCGSCLKFEKGVHPDFIFVDGTEGIKIETVREAIERISLSPLLSKRKVLLFTMAEKMGIEAANALLKTLEEPPLDSVIILTAISEKSLPQTIVSRTQKIKLVPVAQTEVADALKDKFSAAEIGRVLEYSEGNIGEAQKMLTDDEMLKQKTQMVADIKGLFGEGSMIEKFNALEDYEKRKTLKSFFKELTVIIFKSIKEEGTLPELQYAQKVRIAEKILKIYTELDYNVSLRLALEEIILENEILEKAAK